MIKLLVVAGGSTNKLASFLAKRGTFEIEHSFETLSDNVVSIQNQIIKTDKMLYLYQTSVSGYDDGINIKADMQALRAMILEEGFFNPGEVIFVTGKSEECAQAVKYFSVVMGECNKSNYSIKLLDGKISFSAVYDAIMGVSVTRDFNNSYRNVYRVERNATADLAYAAQDDSELIIEPFKYYNLSDYEARKSSAQKTDSGHVYTDAQDTQLQKFHNPDIGQLPYDNVLTTSRVVLLTGKSKSGKSIWASTLAKSASEAGNSVSLLDFTQNGDAGLKLRTFGAVFTEFKILNLLYPLSIKKGSLCVSSLRNKQESSVMLEFLQCLFAKSFLDFDTVFLVIEPQMFDSVYELLEHVITDVLITINPLSMDVIGVQDSLNTALTGGQRVSLILNTCLQLLEGERYLTAEEVKDLTDERVRVVRSHQFVNFNVGPGIYCAIVG